MIEMRLLVSEIEEDSMSDVEDKTSPIKLLLIRTPWYNIGLVVLVTGILIVLNQYTTRVPYTRLSVMINYTITILISLWIISCTMNCKSLYTGLVILFICILFRFNALLLNFII